MTDSPADLSKIHDIVIPDAVSWWPLAPGWWILILAVAGSLLFLGIRRVKRWRANAYRRAGLAALESAESPTEISAVLRRVALAVTPRESVASLRDEEWVRWLGETSSLPVPEELKKDLARSIYSPLNAEPATKALRQFAGEWIRHHTRTC